MSCFAHPQSSNTLFFSRPGLFTPSRGGTVLALAFLVLGILFSAGPASAANQPSVGVFLGTFDPPHTSHLTIALRAIERLGLDQLYLVPNYAPPHKPNATPFLHRHAMARLLTFRHPRLHLFDPPAFEAAYRQDPLNVNRVLIDDIRKLHGPEARLYQIVGADALSRMVEDSRLPAATESRILAAFRRRGFVMPDLRPLYELENRGQLIWVDEDIPEQSSTALRRALAENRDLPAEALLPTIQAYIQRNGLYGASQPRPSFRTLKSFAPDGETPRPLRLTRRSGSEDRFQPASLTGFIAPGHLFEPLTLDIDRYLDERIPASISRLLLSGKVDLTIVAGIYPETLALPASLGYTELWPFFPARERIDLVYLFGWQKGRLHLFVTNLFGRDRLTHTLALFANFFARNGLDPQEIGLFIDREYERLTRAQVDAALGALKGTKDDIIVIGYRGAFEFMLGDLAAFIDRKGLKQFFSSGVADFEDALGSQRPLRMLVPAQGTPGFPWQAHTLPLDGRRRISFVSFRNCYGDQMEDLLENLINRGFQKFILFGNGGALSGRAALDTVYAPTFAGNGNEVLAIANRAWPDFPSRSVLKVQTPLFETLGWLSGSHPFDLVDVEGFDIARTLAHHPEVRIYAGLLVSDQPGGKDITRRDENHPAVISAKRRFFFCALQRMLKENDRPAPRKRSPWVSPRPRSTSELNGATR